MGASSRDTISNITVLRIGISVSESIVNNQNEIRGECLNGQLEINSEIETNTCPSLCSTELINKDNYEMPQKNSHEEHISLEVQTSKDALSEQISDISTPTDSSLVTVIDAVPKNRTNSTHRQIICEGEEEPPKCHKPTERISKDIKGISKDRIVSSSRRKVIEKEYFVNITHELEILISADYISQSGENNIDFTTHSIVKQKVNSVCNIFHNINV